MTTITANVVAHSIIPGAPSIVTVETVYPHMILPQNNTHRAFSNSTQSSRAVPIKRMIAAVKADPYVPRVFLKNVGGMSGGEPIKWQWMARLLWHVAMRFAIVIAQLLSFLGVSKEIANRLLEPFSHVACVLTATEWDNFFALRISEHAQPEIRELAIAIRDAIAASEPRVLEPGEWHLPYVEGTGAWKSGVDASAARCARISYQTRPPEASLDFQKDWSLAKRLRSDHHWSPFEHQARAREEGDPANSNRNLASGWTQARAVVGG